MKNQKKQAFTLIEIMIASLLFSVAMIIATAVFYNTVGSRSKVEVMRDTVQSGRLAMEELTRSIRLANGWYDDYGVKKYSSVEIINNGNNLVLHYTDPDNPSTKRTLIKQYCLCNQPLGQFVCSNTGTRICSANQTNTSFAPITPDSIKVSNLRFSGQSDGLGINQQPYVTIAFTIQPANADSKVTSQNTINLQTTVTSRDYNSWSSPGIGR